MKDERYHLFAQVYLKPEHYEEAKQAVLEMIPLTLAEDGCEVFTLHEASADQGDGAPTPPPATLYLYEVFKDKAAFEFHHAQSYTKEVFAKYQNWLRAPIDIVYLNRIS